MAHRSSWASRDQRVATRRCLGHAPAPRRLGTLPIFNPYDHGYAAQRSFSRPSTVYSAATAALIEANPPTLGGSAPVPASPGAGVNAVDWYTYKRGLGPGTKDLFNPQMDNIIFP